jgi:uncharacterized membrane protein
MKATEFRNKMDRIKNTLLSERFLLFLIVILGIYLRISGIDKPDGLWLDEMMSYHHAKNSFPLGILRDLYYNDFHAPLYYFVLHFWLILFGDNDLVIRFLSALFGVLSIPVAYFAGKELSNYKTGLLSAFIVSLNSFLIYYSQEVRFYSLLAFLGSLSVLFLLKVKNKPDSKNYLGLAIVNACILYTWTMGFVFVFLEVSVFFIYLLMKKKEFKSFIYFQLLTVILYLPYFPVLIHQMKISSQSFIGVFSWIYFDYSSLLIIVQNWFSPILIGIYNNPANYGNLLIEVLKSPNNYFVVIFIIIPCLICFLGLVKAALNKDFTAFILIIVVLFIAIETIATFLGKFGLLARYTALVIPMVIISASQGLLSFNKRRVSTFLICMYAAVNLFYLGTNPQSAFRIPRSEGLKVVSDYLNSLNLNSKDIIIMPYGGRYIGKYYPPGKAIVLSLDIVSFKDNPDREFAFYDQNLLKSLTKDNAYDLLKNYFSDPNPSVFMDSFIRKNVVDELSSNNYVVFVLAPVLYGINEGTLQKIVSRNDIYRSIPMFGMLSSKMAIDIIKTNLKYLNFVSSQNIGVWKVLIFKKK